MLIHWLCRELWPAEGRKQFSSPHLDIYLILDTRKPGDDLLPHPHAAMLGLALAFTVPDQGSPIKGFFQLP